MSIGITPTTVMQPRRAGALLAIVAVAGVVAAAAALWPAHSEGRAEIALMSPSVVVVANPTPFIDHSVVQSLSGVDDPDTIGASSRHLRSVSLDAAVGKLRCEPGASRLACFRIDSQRKPMSPNHYHGRRLIAGVLLTAAALAWAVPAEQTCPTTDGRWCALNAFRSWTSRHCTCVAHASRASGGFPKTRPSGVRLRPTCSRQTVSVVTSTRCWPGGTGIVTIPSVVFDS